jgi:hypothetical protein
MGRYTAAVAAVATTLPPLLPPRAVHGKGLHRRLVAVDAVRRLPPAGASGVHVSPLVV